MTNAGRAWICSVGVVVAVLALCATVAASPAEAATGKSAISKLREKAKKKTIKAVRRQLAAVDATGELAEPSSPTNVKVHSCKAKPKRKPRRFKCNWTAKGELPGVVPVKCSGTSKFDARKKKVKRVSPCENSLDPQAPLLATPHDVSFGYFADFDTAPDLFGFLPAGGANVAREDLNWGTLQPNPGGDPSTWNWRSFDALNAAFANAGVRPVWTLVDAPCWASSSSPCNEDRTNPPARARVGDYANVAAAVARRYPSSAAIEVWLEPNSARFWGADADPPLFSDLVGAAADAVHATGTGVPVFSGGVAPGRKAPDKMEMGEFLAGALARGRVQAADAIAFHAVSDVPFKPPADPTVGYLGRMRILIQELTDVLAAAGSAQPIAVTQLSYSTSGPRAYTEAQQADALVSSYETLRRIAGVPIVIVEGLLDNGDGSKVSGFGVLHNNRSPKPAFCRLAAARGVPTPNGC